MTDTIDKKILDLISGGASAAAISEMISSQLPGRTDGPADAFRHILIAAELARKYSDIYVNTLLNGHEFYQGGAASQMDYFNNEIGKRIGNHVKKNGGNWENVVKLSQEAVEMSLVNYTPQNIDNFLIKQQGGNFVVPRTILIDGGDLAVSAISLLKTNQWKSNPVVDGQPVSIYDSNWPDFNGEWKLNFVPELYEYQEHINYTPVSVDSGLVNNDIMNVVVDISKDSNNASQDDTDALTGTVVPGGDYGVDVDEDIANEDGFINSEVTRVAADDHRIANAELADTQHRNYFEKSVDFLQDNIVAPIANFAFGVADGVNSAFSWVTNLFHSAPDVQNVDPLVLDLDGDGVELISFEDSQVVFDVDADGFKENAGWVSGSDGMLVHDKNNDGVINDITETISEYYNANDNSALIDDENRYFADGLEALKSLDSNDDNLFNSSDILWTTLRVWVDANENGVTEDGELKGLNELEIASIDLNREISYRERLDGNPVLSRSTMTMVDGQLRDVAAVDFATNAVGYEVDDSIVNGIKIELENGKSSSFIVGSGEGITVHLADESVNSAYGNIGDDVLIGDDNDNWLMGGKGSDTLIGGAGDDYLVIDGDDLNENIDGGEGLDVVKIMSDEGVVFNADISNIEVVNASKGDDVIIGGGSGNVFINGDDGDDVIIGGAADDALSGEDGDDMVDGGYGDDIIRGHRGEDVLIGGFGNDILDGGLGADIINGGKGNDVILGNEGNDEIDGGEGFDMVEYAGKYDQYSFSRSDDGGVVVTNVIDGSVDTIKNVERLRFNQVDIDVSGAGTAMPLPVKDNIVVDGNGAFEINQAQLLANDFSTSGKNFTVRNVSDAVGGVVELRDNGSIIFTPDLHFIGTMSFDYSLIDEDGNYATISRKKEDGTIEKADLKAQVNLTNNSDPVDPLYYEQWYLTEIKVKPVWDDYSGEGVSIGVFEGDYGNPLNYNHADLNDNIDPYYLNNILIEDDVEGYSNHATLVAGVIAAEKNGEGSVGIAYNASLASLSWDASIDGLGRLMDYDVANNSWITSQAFGDDFAKDYGDDVSISERERSMENAAEYGRDGLGTSVIFAGGNARQEGDNVNYHNTQNSRFVITTGSINQEGDLSKLVDASQPFSNPGSAILVSAPGSNIKSTANLIENSNGSTFGSDFESTQGTSFSAPIVSGVVALMLEANPNLGYRDIQLILAKTAQKIEDQNTNWQTNSDTSWNGGVGMHYSEDYGFGIVDAHAAVRMAESWVQISNSLNEQTAVSSNNSALNIVDNGSVNSSMTISDSSISLEHVEIYVDIDHSRIGDLVLTLISPDGTESILVNRPEKPLDSGDDNYGSSQNGLKFTLSSTHYLGESGNGDWILKVDDKASGVSGVLNNWDLKFYGSANDANDRYIFTKEFDANATISDAEGDDVIDATGIITDSTVDLRSGNVSSVNGKEFIISEGTTIEDAYLGDGDDILIGNEVSNVLYGGRGNNSLTGNAGSDRFVIFKNADQFDVITDFDSGDLNEKIDLSRFKFSSFSDLTIIQEGSDVLIQFGDGQSLRLKNNDALHLGADNFSGFLNQNQSLEGTSEDDNLYGDDRDSIINAGAGSDYINGGKGDNRLTGGDGDDIFFIENVADKTDIITDFDLGNIAGFESKERISLRNFKDVKDIADLELSQQEADTHIIFSNGQKIVLQNIDKDVLSNNNFIFFGQILGTDAADNIIGSDFPDIMSGGDGDDFLRGLEWDDNIDGGLGNDEILGDHGDDILYGNLGQDIIHGGVGGDVIYGGQDNDILFGGTANDEAGYSDNKTNIIYGESGSDFIYGDKGDDILYGGYGDDEIYGNDGDDEIYGNENNDTIYGEAGNDKIFAGDNDDTVYGGEGNDEIHGGAGNDKIEGIAGDNLIYGDEGDDLIFGGDGIDTIYGGTGNDTIVGESSNAAIIGGGDFLYGQEGDDILLGAASDDEIYGGEGDDVLQGDLGDDKLFGGEGSDVLRGNIGDNEYEGGGGNDIFVIMDNAGGTDIIHDFDINNPHEKINLLNLTEVKDFNQLVLNQVGSDSVIDLGNEQSLVLKNISKDQITRDHFINANSVPEIVAQPVVDAGFINAAFSFNIQNSFSDRDGDMLTYSATLSDGNSLPDWIVFDASTLTFSGTAISNEYNAVIIVTATDPYGASVATSFDFNVYDGAVTNGTPGNDFTVGTSGNDYITGAAGGDYLFGSSGNDIILGGDDNDNIRGDADASYNPDTGIISILNIDINIGDDTLYGGGGDDVIVGDRGNDTIYGDAGNDVILGSEDVDVLYGGEGNDQIAAGIDSNALLTGSYGGIVYGGAGDDTIWGDNGNDIIYGDEGNDYIFGHGGDDVIYAGEGKDIVFAGDGDDIIYLQGDNRLTSFGGSLDTAFSGEGGNDTFIVAKNKDGLSGSGILNDIIYDFEIGNSNEKIDLSAFKNIRDISDLRFSNVNLNGVAFLRVYTAGEESDQYFTLRDIDRVDLQNDNFIFFDDAAPEVANDSLVLDEDGSIIIKVSNLILNDTDAEDGVPIFYDISSEPNHGQLVDNLDGSYTYTADANYNGSDEFSYRVKDSNGAIRSGIANVSVKSVNDIPTATLVNAVTNEDSSVMIDVLNSADDIDGDALVIRNVSDPENGAVSIIIDESSHKQRIVYTPNKDYNGEDSFKYVISDGNGGSITRELTVNIASINDVPITTIKAAVTLEDEAIIIDVLSGASDVDGDDLSIQSVTNASNGTAEVIDGKIHYTPNENYNGSDSLSYVMTDGNGAEVTTILNIDVTSVNDIPTASVTSSIVNEDGTVVIDILLGASDADNDAITLDSNSSPNNGTATIINGKITYIPNENYFGFDAFTYQISDGNGGSITKTLNVEVTSVNDIPIVNISAAATDEDNAVIIDVLDGAIDADGHDLTVESISNASNGIATIVDNKITYIPNENYFGSDSFSYIVSDGNGGTVMKQLTVTINSINDIPTVETSLVSTNEDNSVTIDILENAQDADGDDLVINLIANPSNGVAEIVNNNIFYHPHQNFFGSDSLEYSISDGNGGVVNKILNLFVNSINDEPNATVETAITNEDNSLTIDILSTASDVDGDILAIDSVEDGSHGVASIITGVNGKKLISYIPNANFNGEDSFEYVISDGNGGTISKTLTVTINAINDAPIIGDIASKDLYEDASININLLDGVTDVDDDNLTAAITDNPRHGKLIDNIDGSLTYRPDANYFGKDNFEFSISDGNGGFVTKNIDLNIAAINDAPKVKDGRLLVKEDEKGSIKPLMQDVEDEFFKKDNISIAVAALYGTVVLNDDLTFSYIPNANYFGKDSFSYKVKDSSGEFSNVATVNIDVTSVGDKPTISGRAKVKNAVVGEEYSYDLSYLEFSDVDSDSFDIQIRQSDGSKLPDWLIFDSENKTLSGTPTVGDAGFIKMQIIISDGESSSRQKFGLVVNKPIAVKSDVAVNIISVLEDGSAKGFKGSMDLIMGDDNDNMLQYVADDEWVGTDYVAWNPYSDDRVSVNGLLRSSDAFDGGNGNDSLVLTDKSDGIFLDDLVSDNPSSEGHRLFGIESINGGLGDDVIDLSSARYSYGDVTLNGEAGDDVLWGNDGNDTLNGGVGSDNIQGGRGDDIMSGDAGADTIKGFDGNDILNGGLGIDVLTGGVGSDIFNFNNVLDSGNAAMNMSDIITDFSQGEDSISFTGLNFVDILNQNDATATELADNTNLFYQKNIANNITIITNNDDSFQITLNGQFDMVNSDFNFG